MVAHANASATSLGFSIKPPPVQLPARVIAQPLAAMGSLPHLLLWVTFRMMTLPDGQAKGFRRVLEEQGFNVSHLRTKCSPICAADSTNCCMARLLSQQNNFKHQESMLEVLIRKAGHECIFLPKFHCKPNPIEMACHPLYHWLDYSLKTIFFQFWFHQYWGWAKYRYREVPKEGFAQAKELTMKWLDACPDEVI
jgi:hypothetical protein